MIGQRGEQTLTGKAFGNAEDSEKEKQQRAHDERQLPEKILIHKEKNRNKTNPDAMCLYFVFGSSSAVVTCSTEALVTSTTILFGGTRRCTESSLSAMIVPRKPPLVVTLSPVLS